MNLKTLSHKKIFSNNQGMTLIEIMVVLVLIGLIAGAVGTNIMGRLSTGKYSQSKTQVLEMVKALETFYLDCGSYPSETDGLKALVEESSAGDCASWSGPYVKRIPKDAWGKELIYELSGDSDPVIVSLGADKKEGGTKLDKDIVSSEL